MKIIVKKKRIKKIYLRVSSKDGSVNISAPYGTPDKIIKEFVEKNIKWIEERQAKVLADKRQSEMPLESGSTVYLWGCKYVLNVRQAFSNAVIQRDDDILVFVKQASSVNGVLEKWLRNKLKERIAERSVVWEKVVGKQAAEYAIRKMTRCWGNCRPKTGRIAINYEIVHKAPECLDYVLVHELVHFYELYHNERFWGLVESFYPNWKLVKNLLNK